MPAMSSSAMVAQSASSICGCSASLRKYVGTVDGSSGAGALGAAQLSEL